MTLPFLIGDYTAMIVTRLENVQPTPNHCRVSKCLKNAKTYQEQCFKIMIRIKLKCAQLRMVCNQNSGWFNSVGITGKRLHVCFDVMTSPSVIKPSTIAIHEFLYPSGSRLWHDCPLKRGCWIRRYRTKTFNILMGVHFNVVMIQDAQVCITVPIPWRFMSGVQEWLSLWVTIFGEFDAPGAMYQKVLSMPIALNWSYFDLLSFKSVKTLKSSKDEIARRA